MAKGRAPSEDECFVGGQSERCRGKVTGARGSRMQGYGEQEGKLRGRAVKNGRPARVEAFNARFLPLLQTSR